MSPQETPVRVVLLGEPVAVAPGTLISVTEHSFTLRLLAADLVVGRRLVAVAGDSKLAGQVTAIEGGIATVARSDVHGTDDRGAPRVQAPVALSWRRSGGAWRQAAADDLSISGARFLTEADPPKVGDHLAIALHLDGPAPHPIEALVRRSAPAPGGWTVAVEFVEVPDDTSDALTDLTLRA